MTVPRWVVFSPITLSLAALIPGLFGLDWCDDRPGSTCRVAVDAMSWVGAGFPHMLAAPLSLALGAWASLSVLLLLDGLLWVGATRWVPRHVGGGQAAALVVGWLVLTAAALLATPRIMIWTSLAFH